MQDLKQVALEDGHGERVSRARRMYCVLIDGKDKTKRVLGLFVSFRAAFRACIAVPEDEGYACVARLETRWPSEWSWE